MPCRSASAQVIRPLPLSSQHPSGSLSQLLPDPAGGDNGVAVAGGGYGAEP